MNNQTKTEFGTQVKDFRKSRDQSELKPLRQAVISFLTEHVAEVVGFFTQVFHFIYLCDKLRSSGYDAIQLNGDGLGKIEIRRIPKQTNQEPKTQPLIDPIQQFLKPYFKKVQEAYSGTPRKRGNHSSTSVSNPPGDVYQYNFDMLLPSLEERVST